MEDCENNMIDVFSRDKRGKWLTGEGLSEGRSHARRMKVNSEARDWSPMEHAAVAQQPERES